MTTHSHHAGRMAGPDAAVRCSHADVQRGIGAGGFFIHDCEFAPGDECEQDKQWQESEQ